MYFLMTDPIVILVVALMNIFSLPKIYYLLTVPPLVWNGWKGLGAHTSIGR